MPKHLNKVFDGKKFWKLLDGEMKRRGVNKMQFMRETGIFPYTLAKLSSGKHILSVHNYLAARMWLDRGSDGAIDHTGYIIGGTGTTGNSEGSAGTGGRV